MRNSSYTITNVLVDDLKQNQDAAVSNTHAAAEMQSGKPQPERMRHGGEPEIVVNRKSQPFSSHY